MAAEFRKVKKTVTGIQATDGAGVKLVRVIGYRDVRDFDPFLMLDAFDSTNPDDYTKGFPWHPHRGIETVTYLIEGDMEHSDSLGNKGSIRNGDCQWMTAGSGIIHQEMPKMSSRMLGAQLWINLPAEQKMAPPKYRDISSSQIPEVEEAGGRTRVICGSYKGTAGAVQGDYVKPVYLDVEVKPGSEWTLDTVPEATLFLYIVRGEAFFEPDTASVIEEKHAVLFHEGSKLHVKTGGKGVRFLLMSGMPLRESIAWGGPVVMNTEEELSEAFRELEKGNFIKDK